MLSVTARIGRTGSPHLVPLVLGLDGEDRLSAGFLWHLDLAWSAAVPARDTLGQAALVTIARGAEPVARAISALVTGWDDLGTVDVPGQGALHAYRARLEPRLARLEHDLGDGVHAGRTAIQVACDLLAGCHHAGAAAVPALAVPFYDGFLSEPRPARQQVLRWRESTAATVRRLLEDEGVFTYHVHRDDDGLGSHVLVLSERNRNSGQPVADEDAEAGRRRSRAANPVVGDVVRGRGEAASHRRLWRWQTVDRDGPSAVAVEDHDYRDWSANAKADGSGERTLDLDALGLRPGPAELVRHEFPAGLAGLADDSDFDPAPGHADTTCAGRLAERRAAEQLCRRRRLHGEGDHVALQAGAVMSFADRPEESFLVVAARLSLRPVLAVAVPGAAELPRPLLDIVAGQAAAAAETRWTRPAFDLLAEPPRTPGATLSWQGLGLEARCRVEALPLAVPFVPPRQQPPPALAGVHLATVVAEAGADAVVPAVSTDELARVRVAFPWDPEHPTGWVRVVQPQAGDGGGMLIIPRVGDEVAVAFAWGESDQPVVLGGLFNHENLPPHDPAEHPGRTVLRSRGIKTNGAADPSDERHEELPAATRIAKAGEEFALVEDSVDKPELAERKCSELALDDTAGAERADLFAARDLHLQSAHDGILRAGRKLVIDAGESLVIRVGNTMLTMEHGELKVGVYCASVPDASSALSMSPAEIKASAPAVAITGLIGASLSSAAATVKTELSGVTIAGISAEMKTDVLGALNALTPIAQLTTGAIAAAVGHGDGADDEVLAEYEEGLPWPEIAALAEEGLMSGAEAFRVAALVVKDPTALLGTAKVECLGGKVEVFSSPAVATRILGAIESVSTATGSAFADFPGSLGCQITATGFSGLSSLLSAASSVASLFSIKTALIELNPLGRFEERSINRHEEYVDKHELGLNHALEAVDHRVTAVDQRVTAVDHKVDVVDGHFVGVNRQIAAVDNKIEAVSDELLATNAQVEVLEHRNTALTVNYTVTNYQLTAVLVQL
jgi:uncharacterized protein involved in type VI secretion and phage assembly